MSWHLDDSHYTSSLGLTLLQVETLRLILRVSDIDFTLTDLGSLTIDIIMHARGDMPLRNAIQSSTATSTYAEDDDWIGTATKAMRHQNRSNSLTM